MATKVADAPKRARKQAREELPNTPNPVDIAMVAAVSGKPLPDIARRVLEEEARLIRAQCTELRLREIGERVRAALWAILAVAAFAIVALIVLLIVHASRTDALVVESFRVPPAMAQQGLTGDVIATEVLDRIAEFQQRTQSVRAATSYSNNWGDDIKIDIPETGATADQVWKLLRGWLGKETRISGEVIQTPAGLALTTRVGSEPGQRFVSKTGDLDALIAQGAEHIMAATQPYRFAIYLNRVGRRGESLASLQQLTSDPSPIERKWAYNGIAVAHRQRGDFLGELEAARRALAIDPNMVPATENVGDAQWGLGHDQEAVDARRRALSIPNSGEYDPRIFEANHCNDFDALAARTADQAQLRQAIACLSTAPESYRTYIPSDRSDIAILRHDPALIADEQPSPFLAPQEAASDNALFRFRMLLANDTRGAPLEKALIDVATTQTQLVNAGKTALPTAVPISVDFYEAIEPIVLWPYEAQALAKLGRGGDAAALIAKTPLDCYACLRARGSIAEERGDLRAAQLWFLKAAQQAPRLAPAFVDWGRLLLDARHYGSAEVKFGYAAQMAPNWADPLKYWGDALAGEGKRGQALAKYDAALKLAPNWLQLQQARARLAAH